ncbi:MAG: hypothetical protein EZS28_041784, partial [Streblomastix strix]
ILTGFFLIFRDNLSETRLATAARPCPFKGTPNTNKAHKEILQTVLKEGIKEITSRELVKCWNPIFIKLKPDVGWRMILDATQLNNEILPLYSQKQGVDNVKMIISSMDWMNKLDLKPVSHHLTIQEPHKSYLAFEVESECNRYQGMLFRTQHSPKFFTEAMNRILAEVRKTWDLRIINYSDDILLLYQDQMILKQQTIRLTEIFEQFCLTLSLKKCELELKQEIVFLGWTWNSATMELFKPNDRRSTNLDLLKSFLRTQFSEVSLYLMLLYSAQTQAAKERG